MKELIQTYLNQAGISINGPAAWDMKVHNLALYSKLAKDPELSLGETYVEGFWDCENLDEFFYRILSANLEEKISRDPRFWRYRILQKIHETTRRLFNFQTKRKSLKVAEKHYDVGNDLFQLMLDKSMMYSCAYAWEAARTLEEAQEMKLKLICQKLDLKPGMSVLDIGCGWGGFAKYAAQNYQVSVIGITISQEQYELAKLRCADLSVQICLQDYREFLDLNHKFDRIVSIGMFEHVGPKNYLTYMNAAAHSLKEDGLFLLHTIGNNASCNYASRWIDKYIFPNGHIPSVSQIGKSIENIFVMEDWHNIGINYDQTLLNWHKNFNENWNKIQHKYDNRFRRMWNYYLLSCAASFRARKNQVWQILLSKKGLKDGFQRKHL